VNSPEKLYEKRKNAYNKLLQRQTRASNLISNLRLLVIAAGIAASVFLYITKNYILLTGVAIATLVLFIYLVVRHEKLIKNIEYSMLLSKINEDSLRRCNGEWNQFSDDGKEFVDENHPYSYDLDIFGANSLFQLINTAKTYTGRHILKTLLTQYPTNTSDILQRQKAVEELATKLSWRQRFLAEALIAKSSIQNPEELFAWVNKRNPFFMKHWVILLTRLVPAVTVSILLIALLTGKVTYYIPAFMLIVQYTLLAVNRKERVKNFSLAKKYYKDINVYYHMIKHFENEKFQCDYLNELKCGMLNSENTTASKQIDKLSKIVESLKSRSNAFYLVFNILFLWDFHNIILLEKWKEKSGPFLKSWIEAIGNVEDLASLSILRFDNREWIMPEIVADKECIFDAKKMAHPLLTGQRVDNDLQIQPPVRTLLITGSNMSGKSTLLRSAGINLVLAYAGAPVCAEFFRVSIMQIHTCMRISDNLGKSISSFYAELLRIKTIVQEAKEGKNVFYLLDEIFKGTNSADRHLGAKVLIQKLCLTKSIGMVSTHDLELCDLEKENKAVRNYHFQEYYKDNKIYFDYKLRPGASTTRNAIYLMKLAGIDVENMEN